MPMNHTDVIVIGAGHNGLVCALLLARAGLSVRVFEEQPVIGGAVRTERPFAKAPGLGTSTGAYLLGLMQPELLQKLDLALPLKRRSPHYFLPTTGARYLLIGGDEAETKRQMLAFFSEQDWTAHVALNQEIAAIRDDVAPTWLAEPLSIEETADRYLRPALREVFVKLCRGSVGDYLDRFGFKSDLLKAMYAVTDGFSGLTGTWNTPGTGMNFLAHNMCRLPGADGTWMIVEGGMGTITTRLADAVRKEGVEIEVSAAIASIETTSGIATSVNLVDGRTFGARVIVTNADPFRMRELVGRENLSASFNERIDGYKRLGTTMKVNLALSKLPRFTCLPDDHGQYGPTIHLLPDEGNIIDHLVKSFADVQAGKLPEFPTIEWYIHTTVDPTLRDAAGNHNSALFVQWVPYQPVGSSWDVETDRYVKHLLSICDRFAPGTSDAVVDVFALPPPRIEKHFGIRHGHIHHVDNSYGFSDRLPYRSPIAGLYSCSAGTHPAGSVIGSAGHNAAMAVLRDLNQ